MSFLKSQISNLKSIKGFTLIELVVVIAIMALLSGFVLANYRQGQSRYDLETAAQIFIANLRRAQNLAMVGLEQNGASPFGYGIYTPDSNSYLIFYNQTGDNDYQPASIDLEVISLPSRVFISPIGRSIFFTPPDPTTYINGENSGSQSFTLTKDGEIRSVTIYSSGRIE
ncbi:MAG: hypothetical protein A3I88_03230 [Candidatus Portnoybacteria bacterium RIFCSPLOWO2_12_FULL_39_9]|uniref:General secretion pathway GspH domain-containing protein n=1 Tax=Candidatus Portnoybacteria bacterium RIFCSPHIGHO2_12_FULL_38_9 TaxID=1801997 RepID=A0A1G2FF81_9BACT|nr:MAG: hypothetical protein A3H00_00780 [Candidatus Portnoybacteria bacterium RBG_13_40_8]OGZ36047.1 MAG: hypothetical protein A2646_00835 [Candidatus Portnoybacteria bacterium RIFCSPHIGHO2_02_FULL_39_12]OGZ36736.1 MAG: hypothetical protein A3J64_03335 [Candidatus Portnoybacteria bacterium RIFCSPHIGHO2_12_FULL_38_9]OGZ38095.1 MAG: hypothetical protein A3F21_00935 [Candidatus Portnoybacteria bacterium RIFCSPLOWO2_01_FULL_38_39]OGZ40102.1 MAG: hypothetical protein A3I88_03230 [Candidatus Portnoy